MGTLDTPTPSGLQCTKLGTPSPDVIEADGLLHRFHVEGDKRGTLNGWYCLHLDGRAAGIFGNWKPASARPGRRTGGDSTKPNAKPLPSWCGPHAPRRKRSGGPGTKRRQSRPGGNGRKHPPRRRIRT